MSASYACPFMAVCEREVDYRYFRTVCCTPAHAECEAYKEMAERRKRPREWREELWR